MTWAVKTMSVRNTRPKLTLATMVERALHKQLRGSFDRTCERIRSACYKKNL